MHADLHCHPHFRSFNWLYGSTDQSNIARYHPWSIVPSHKASESRGTKATNYSQCDMAKLSNGGVKLAFASLYPLERGFFIGTRQAKRENLVKVYECLEKDDDQNLAESIIGTVGKELASLLLDKGTPTRKLAQMIYMDVPGKRVKQIWDNGYDYWKALQDEYAFIKTRDGQQCDCEIYIPYFQNDHARIKELREACPLDYVAQNTYHLTHNAAEVQEAIRKDEIALVLTIEGMHALGSDTETIDVVLSRISTIKNWDHPPFFITFAHHFDNGLCGHAHSLPKVADLIADQSKNLNKGFNKNGLTAARALLCLDGENNLIPHERRILIDVKHMSAAARKDFYDEIVNKAYAKGDVIPVIASHVGYSGIKNIDEMVSRCALENDDTLEDKFYAWNINLCDTDVEMVFKTGGLIGMSLDQRILGYHKKLNDDNSINLLGRNIKGMLDAVIYNEDIPYEEKRNRLWDMIAIGSDNEGYIDPINDYPTTLHFDKMQQDLILWIQKHLVDNQEQSEVPIGNGRKVRMSQAEKYFLSAELTVSDVVRKICFRNANEFVLKHFK